MGLELEPSRCASELRGRGEEMKGLAFARLGPTLGQAGVGAPEKPVELGERDMRKRY